MSDDRAEASAPSTQASAPSTPPPKVDDASEEIARDVPPFARAYPADPELSVLVDAFTRGNYAFVRTEAPKLAARAQAPAVRAAAADLRRRIAPDPLAGLLLLVGIALLVVLASHYLGHRPETPGPPSNQRVAPPQPRPT